MKMMNSKNSQLGFLLNAFICLMLFQGCAQMTLTHVAKLRIGMTIVETLSVTNVSPKHKFILDNIDTADEIEVHSYLLSSGDYISNYFLVFRNKKLIFWGYPHEYARNNDPFINKIGQQAVSELDEL